MSEIATYRCINPRCRRTIFLSKDFPVWKEQTPKHLRSLTVSPEAKSYVARHRSESYCHTCYRAVEPLPDSSCPHCATPDLPLEYTGQKCVQCKKGSFTLVHLRVH